MNVVDFNLVDPVIHSSEKLGALTPAAIFAFMWLWQAVKELRRENQESVQKRQENERREQGILSEERQTEAIKAMAQNIVMLKDAHNAQMLQATLLHTIIAERLPPK